MPRWSAMGSRACIFCGEPADSDEHLLPVWLQGVLPSDEPVLHYRQIGRDEGERQEWMKRPFREKAGVVCNDCNTGWMSRLENRAKPILTPAITYAALPLRMTASEQRIVAAWAFKTVLVFQRSQGDSVAPPFHANYLRDRQEPPEQVVIWFGSNYAGRGGDAAVSYVQRPLSVFIDGADEEQPREFGYAAFLAVAGMSFFVIGHQYRNRVDFRLNNMAADLFIPIHPYTGLPVSWPPELMMDEQFVDVLFHQVEPPTIEARIHRAA
jgi:hypothetical protein